MSLLDSFWTKTNELASSALNNVTSTLSRSSNSLTCPTSSGSSGGSTDPSLQNRKYTVRISQNNNYVVGAVPDTVEMNQSATWNAPWAGGISGKMGDMMSLVMGTRLVAQVLTLQVWQGGGNNDLDFSIQFELRAYSDAERDVMIPLKTLLSMTMPTLSNNGFLNAPGPQISQDTIKRIGAGAAAIADKSASVIASTVSKGVSFSNGTMSDGNKTSLSESAQNAMNEISTAASQNGLSRKSIEDSMTNKIKVEIGDWFRMTNVVITDVRHTFKSQRPGAATGTLMAADVTVSFRPMFTLTAEDVDNLIGASSS